MNYKYECVVSVFSCSTFQHMLYIIYIILFVDCVVFFITIRVYCACTCMYIYYIYSMHNYPCNCVLISCLPLVLNAFKVAFNFCLNFKQQLKLPIPLIIRLLLLY